MRHLYWAVVVLFIMSCTETKQPTVEISDTVTEAGAFDKEKYLLRYLSKEVKNDKCKAATQAKWVVIIQAANCGSCDKRAVRLLQDIVSLETDGYIVFTSKQTGSETIDSTLNHACVYYDQGNFHKYGLFHKENYFFVLKDSAIHHWAYLTDEYTDSIRAWLK